MDKPIKPVRFDSMFSFSFHYDRHPDGRAGTWSFAPRDGWKHHTSHDEAMEYAAQELRSERGIV